MKVSELVAELQLLQQVHGDLETSIWDEGCGCCGGWHVDPDPRYLLVADKYDDFDVGTEIIRLN